jgi:hypothetical protein
MLGAHVRVIVKTNSVGARRLVQSAQKNANVITQPARTKIR